MRLSCEACLTCIPWEIYCPSPSKPYQHIDDDDNDERDTKTKLGLPDGGEDAEYNDVGVMGISKIFVTKDVIFFGIQPFDRVYPTSHLYKHRLDSDKSYSSHLNLE